LLGWRPKIISQNVGSQTCLAYVEKPRNIENVFYFILFWS
jgi:hypothetical protein